MPNYDVSETAARSARLTPQLDRSLRAMTWDERWRGVIVGLLMPVAVALALSAYIAQL